MMSCPCGSSRDYASCCGPFIEGDAKAPTAEQLMRSRYTAYVRARIDYITKTHDPSTRSSHDEEAARAWAESAEWMGLEILSTEAGGANDERGEVEFIARYRNEDGEQEHREISEFRKHHGAWYFTSGKVLGLQPVRRDSPKVGRNDPCPCGSGKKFKKCCG